MKKVKSCDAMHERRVGLRWGRLLTGVQAARFGLGIVYGEKSLLPKTLLEELQDLHCRLEGLEQSLWRQEQKDAEA